MLHGFRTAGTVCLVVAVVGYVLTRSSFVPVAVLGWAVMSLGGVGELLCTVTAVALWRRNRH
jgi:hypothetical protein